MPPEPAGPAVAADVAGEAWRGGAIREGSTYRVVLGAGLLIWLSSAPLVQLATRVFDGSTGPGSAAFTLGVVVPAAAGAALFAGAWAGACRSARAWAPAALLAGWTVASTFWSDAPDTTALDSVLVLGVVLGAVWFAVALDVEQRLAAVAVAMQLLTVVSVLYALVSHAGRGLGGWQGVFGSRNTLGPVAIVAAIATVAVTISWRARGRLLAVPAALLVVDVVAAERAGARTPVLAAVGAIVIVGGASAAARRAREPLRAGAVAWVVAAAVTVTVTVVLWGATRSASADRRLSYRPAVWRHVVAAADVHPVGGFGFGAFWLDKTFLDPLYLETGLVFDNAHNTVVEMLIGTGVVGALLAAAVLILAVARSTEAALSGSVAAAGWAAIGLFAVFENMTEAFIVYHSSFWLIAVAASVAAVANPTRAVRRGPTA